MMDSAPLLFGLVLMGGQSRRMGRDKSGIVYHGKPQRDHLTELLRPFCNQVYWSVNRAQSETLTYPGQLLDQYPEHGPLGGILTAMHTHPAVAWLIVPCDLPRLDNRTLSALVAGRDALAPATAFWDDERSGPEPLVSIWEPTAAPLLQPYFDAGNRSPRRFLIQHGAHLLNAPDATAFENVNAM